VRSANPWLAECVVAKDDDCRDSEVCKRFGWCSALKNPNVYVTDVEATVCFTTPSRDPKEQPRVGSGKGR